MPVLAVTGPRQSGKTTLCRQAFPELDYVTLEALDQRDFAREDPRGFLRAHGDGAILDEVQRVPELLSYLQGEVDERPEPGRFVLTGSQHFGLTEAISQSLAGRVANLYLLPPSLDELGRFGAQPDDLWELVWSGSYPRIYDQGLDPGQWLADYAATYIQRDVRQVLNVGDLEAFTTFVRLVAGRTSAELNLSTLGADAGVSHNTARAWLSVLEASFICFRLPSWRRSKRKQVVKSPKIHFMDSGLACYFLGINEPGQLEFHPLRGAIFESWVASEIYKSRVHRRLQPNLYHLRDAKGFEVDLLIEQGAKLTAVEAKSAETAVPEFFRSLGRVEADVRAVVYGGAASEDRRGAELIGWRDIQRRSW